MSSGERFEYGYAHYVATRLALELGPVVGPTLEVVGSLRRLCADVGDIEFIAPMPAEDQPDELYRQLAARFWSLEVAEPARPKPKAFQGSLFGAPLRPTIELPPRERRLGEPIRGLKPRFRAADVWLNLKEPVERRIKVQVFRYDAGRDGNYGWCKVVRTGDEDFVRSLLFHINQRWKGRSDLGYLRNHEDLPLRQDTEEQVFALAGVSVVEPQMRFKVPIRSIA